MNFSEAEKGKNEIDLLLVLNNFLKTQMKVYDDFFLSNDDFKYIFKELKDRNFLIKILQYQTDNINMLVSL